MPCADCRADRVNRDRWGRTDCEYCTYYQTVEWRIERLEGFISEGVVKIETRYIPLVPEECYSDIKKLNERMDGIENFVIKSTQRHPKKKKSYKEYV